MKNIVAKAEVIINASPEQVWEGLTSPEMIKEYFFGTDAKSTWEIGDIVTFDGEYDGKKYHDKGRVLQVQPNHLLQYSYWSSMSGMDDRPENYVAITYEIQEENGQTILDVTQENIQDEERKEHSEENWKIVLNNLKHLLENKSVISTGL